MKYRTRYALLGLGLLFVALSVQAQPKIAVINMTNVFYGYWKTKQSDATVQERKADYDKERKKMQDDYERLNLEYRKLDESSRDPAASPEEQKRRKESMNSKLLELREIEQSVRSFEQNFRTQLEDQIQRMRERIFTDIREVVDSRARAAGYNLVIDATAQARSGTPIVMFVSGLPDLTQEVLTELNAKAPPGALDDKKPFEEKKDETK